MKLTLLIIGRKRQDYFQNLNLRGNESESQRYKVLEYIYKQDQYQISRYHCEYRFMTDSKNVLRVYLDCMGMKIGKCIDWSGKDTSIGEYYDKVLGSYREYELVEKENS